MGMATSQVEPYEGMTLIRWVVPKAPPPPPPPKPKGPTLQERIATLKEKRRKEAEREVTMSAASASPSAWQQRVMAKQTTHAGLAV